MAQLVREAMTSEPICLTNNTTITDAASQMRDYDIGDVLVTENGRIRGVLTDREFGDWSKEAWPALSDSVLREYRAY